MTPQVQERPSLWLLYKGIGFFLSEGRTVDVKVVHYIPAPHRYDRCNRLLTLLYTLTGTGMQTNGRSSSHIQRLLPSRLSNSDALHLVIRPIETDALAFVTEDPDARPG